MNHVEVRAALSEYLEGDLDLGRRALVDAHLDGCGECSHEVDQLIATVSLLRALPDPEPPFDLANNVMRRVRSGEADSGWLARLGSWVADLLWPGLAVPVAAMVAALALAFLSGRVTLPILEQGITPTVVATSEVPRSAIVPANPIVPEVGPRGWVPGAPRPALVALDSNTADKSYIEGIRRDLDRGKDFPRTPDDWLMVLQSSPVRFAKVQSALTEAEQELWTRQLARRAVELGLVDQIESVLARSRSVDAGNFAERFQEEARAYAAAQ